MEIEKINLFHENGLGKLGLVSASIAATGLFTLSVSQFADITCPALVNLGHPCPFCGLTRAFTEFASFNNNLDYLALVNVAPLLLIGSVIVFHILAVLRRKKFLGLVPMLSFLLVFSIFFRYFEIFDNPEFFAIQ